MDCQKPFEPHEDKIILEPGLYKVMYQGISITFNEGLLIGSREALDFDLSLLQGQAEIVKDGRVVKVMLKNSVTKAEGTHPKNRRTFFTSRQPQGFDLSTKDIFDFDLNVPEPEPARFFLSLESANQLHGIFKTDRTCVYPSSRKKYQDVQPINYGESSSQSKRQKKSP